MPDIAVRFRNAGRGAAQAPGEPPLMGPRYRIDDSDFAVCILGLAKDFLEGHTLQVIRILHGKRDVQQILGREETGLPRSRRGRYLSQLETDF